jgi:uncharacterized protein YjbJ (UPF0337 family)
MRGEMRSWWGKVTDDDLEKIAGRRDRLLGTLQEKYGYTREAAQQEIDRRFKEYDDRMRVSSPSTSGDTRHSSTANVGTARDPKAAETRGTGERGGSSGTAAASQPISTVGEKMESLADVIRDKAPREGAVGTAATTVAEKLDAAGSYLQANDMDHVMNDLSGMIRRYPVPALLIGLGLGYLLARSTRR